MSLERKTDDGDSAGRSTVLAEWGNPFSDESETGEYAPNQRTVKHARSITVDDDEVDTESEKDRYLITYADFITLLLGLFIILYSISKVDMDKYENLVYAMSGVFGKELDSVHVKMNSNIVTLNPVQKIREEVNDLIEEMHYDHSIRLEENERGLTIRILEDILFKSGSASLNNDCRFMLSKLATIIRKIPNDVRVEGHTDDVPIKTNEFPSNWHLSVNRALNTAYFLIEEEKLPASKISIVGYSEYKPIVKNTNAANRALNRRVDIVIIK